MHEYVLLVFLIVRISTFNNIIQPGMSVNKPPENGRLMKFLMFCRVVWNHGGTLEVHFETNIMVIDPSRVVVWLDKWEKMMSGMFPSLAITRIMNDCHIFGVEQNPQFIFLLVESFRWQFFFQESHPNRHRNRNPISPICSAAAETASLATVVGKWSTQMLKRRRWHQRPKDSVQIQSGMIF